MPGKTIAREFSAANDSSPGQVLGAMISKLPETAAGSVKFLAPGVVLLLSGAGLLRRRSRQKV